MQRGGPLLTDTQVIDIRERYIHGRPSKTRKLNVIELAKEFNVSQETIRNVAKGNAYQWVK